MPLPEDSKEDNVYLASSNGDINLGILSALFKKQYRGLAKAKDKELILLLGLSGSGKSTAVNYLKGNKMQLDMTDTGEQYLQLLPGQNPEDCASMGNAYESETLSPNIIPFSGNQFFADCPGFEDNRGEEYKVCSEITTQLVINWAASIRSVLIVIDYSHISEKAADFSRLISLLTQIFNFPSSEHPASPISFIFLINKTPPRIKETQLILKLNQLKKSKDKELENIKAMSREGSLSPEAMERFERLQGDLSFLKFVLDQQSNILILNPLDAGHSRLACLELLERLPSIPKNFFALPENKSPGYCQFTDVITQFSEQLANFLYQRKEQVENLQRQKKELASKNKLKTDCESADLDNAGILEIPRYLKGCLGFASEQLLQLKDSLAELDFAISELDTEEKELNDPAEVLYQTIRKERPSEKIAAIVGCSTTALLATVLGIATGGAAVPFVLGGVLMAAVRQNYVAHNPICLSYAGIPFVRAELDPPLDYDDPPPIDKPEEGYYEAKIHRFNPLEVHSFCLNVYVQRRNLPPNARRLEAIYRERPIIKLARAAKSAEVNKKSEEKKKINALIVRFESAAKQKKIRPGFVSPECQDTFDQSMDLVSRDLLEQIRKLEEDIQKNKKALQIVEEKLRDGRSLMEFIDLVSDSVAGDTPQVKRFLQFYKPFCLEVVAADSEQDEAKQSSPPVLSQEEQWMQAILKAQAIARAYLARKRLGKEKKSENLCLEGRAESPLSSQSLALAIAPPQAPPLPVLENDARDYDIVDPVAEGIEISHL